MTQEPLKPDPDETADDETASGAESPFNGDVTRLASDAELADLARLRTAAPRRRKKIFGLVVFLLIGVIAAFVVILLARQEKELSWPGEMDGSYDDERRILDVAPDAALLVYWPNGPRTVVTGDGTNEINVVTGVGRGRDVPFHLNVTLTALTNGLRTTTAASYAEWKQARRQDGWLFDANSEELVFINSKESGYPAWQITYGRRCGDSRFGGRVLYVRHLDREIVLLRELPVAYWTRADWILDAYPCLAANLTAVRARFEIPAVRVSGDPAALLDEAYASVQNNFLSSDWRILDRTLRSLILSAMESGDEQRVQNVRLVYSTFRMKLQNWYSGQCLSFGFTSSPDEDDNSNLAPMRTAIRRECARRLPDESDARQWRIAHDDWSL